MHAPTSGGLAGAGVVFWGGFNWGVEMTNIPGVLHRLPRDEGQRLFAGMPQLPQFRGHEQGPAEGHALQEAHGRPEGKTCLEAKLVQHLTSSPKVRLADGTEEEHKVIATRPAKDLAQVRNLVEYILAQTKK